MPSKTSAKPSGSWAFRARFRREAFGWRGSRLAIERINEALAEIRASTRRDPALSQLDRSSGALGRVTHAAVEKLVSVIAQAMPSAATGWSACSGRSRTTTRPSVGGP